MLINQGCRPVPHPPRRTRSYLYVPADSRTRLAGAATRGAEAVIADLEDSVASGSKSMARLNAKDWLADAPAVDQAAPHGRVERWVRINHGEQGLDDLAEILRPGIAGVCVPKVGSAEDVRRVCVVLDNFEDNMQLASGAIALMPLIETAAGLQSLQEIAASPRVQRLQIGELDLAADLELWVDEQEAELLPLRMSVVVASAAAGLSAPVGAVSAEFHDLSRFAASTERLKRAGFYGRAAIHPAQLVAIHQVFGVGAKELRAARTVIELYETALKSGVGAIVGPDGRMIDEAVVRRSRQIIEVARMDEQGDRQ